MLRRVWRKPDFPRPSPVSSREKEPELCQCGQVRALPTDAFRKEPSRSWCGLVCCQRGVLGRSLIDRSYTADHGGHEGFLFMDMLDEDFTVEPSEALRVLFAVPTRPDSAVDVCAAACLRIRI